MLVQVAAVAAAKKRGAGEELWTRLITVGSLSKQEALTAWSASTWSIYKRSLVEMRWGVKLADGGLQWIGPQDATFTQLHQYRMKDRVR